MEKELPVRKKIRLEGYYFITICVKDGHEMLWDVGARIARPLSRIDETVKTAHPLSRIGETVKTAIENISKIYANVIVDKYVIMPNHIHMIIVLDKDNGVRNDDNGVHNDDRGRNDDNGVYNDDRGRNDSGVRNDNGGRAMRAPTVSTVVNQMKGYVTKQIGFSIWQKLFYDEIIRNEKAYQTIWQYIDENPQKWENDKHE